MSTVQVSRTSSLVQVSATRPQVAVGTPSVVSHNALSNRSDADAHPTSAITGLDAALATKAPLSHVGSGGTAHANATASVAGFMSSSDKTTLDAVQSKLDGKAPLHGIANRDSLSLSYSAATRILTVTGTLQGYIRGVPYTLAANYAFAAHANSTNGYFFYLNESGAPVISTSPWDLEDHAPIAYVFYDATLVDGFPFYELHDAWRDPLTHKRLHEVDGTQVVPGSGFDATGYILNSDTNANKTFAISGGTVADEDIRVVASAVADGGPYCIMRRSGASGVWTWTKTSTFPFLDSGVDIQYNQFTGSTWQLTALSGTQFFNMWAFVLPTFSGPQIVFVVGQGVYGTQGDAEAESVAGIQWGTIPFQEIAPLYQFTYRRAASNGNQGKADLRRVARLAGSRNTIAVSGTSPTTAAAVSFVPSGDISATTVQAALEEIDAEKQPLDPDLTGLASDYDAATKTLTHNVSKAATSGGLTIQNGAGASVLLLGAGPSQGITAYGQINGTSVSLSGGVTATDVTAIGAGGILDRQAATQDGIRLLGRAGGTTSLLATLTPGALTASRTYTGPDLDGTLALTGASQAVSFAGITCTTVTASGGTTPSDPVTTSVGIGNGTVKVGGFVFIGSTGSGTGGNFRLLGDNGTSKWLAGILGTVGARDFTIYDQVNAATRLTIDATSGNLFAPQSAAIGTTALVASERMRIAGGSAPTTPGATDVLFGDGRVRLGNTSIASIQTAGGATIAGNIDCGGTITFKNTANTSGYDFGLLGGAADATAYILNRQSGANINLGTGNVTGLVVLTPVLASGRLAVNYTTTSTSTTTGALIVAGGMGVAGNITFDGSTGASLRMVNATANGSVATTLGSVGPTGANAGNPLGWVRINVAGTDRYIPYW